MQTPDADSGFGYLRSIAIDGDHVYVTDGETGLTIMDLSTPSVPSHVGVLPMEGYARGVAVSNGLACIAGAQGGMRVADGKLTHEPLRGGTAWWDNQPT